MLDALEERGAKRVLLLLEPKLGLRAVLVLDDLTLGPGVGGIRTRAYASAEEAALDAARLARAMTVKCALAGLDAGGAKMVVMDHPGLARAAAFEWLGERVQELGGLFRTAGDLGTTDQDLAALARSTEFVHRDEGRLADAVALGLSACVDAALEGRHPRGDRWTVSVQGAGAIGGAVVRRLSARGMRVRVADPVSARAEALARETGAQVVDPAQVLSEPTDVLSPCAVGGVIDTGVAERVTAQVVVGAANNILTDPEAGRVLHRRGVALVPDPIASAGAVVAGIGRTVMGLADTRPLIERLGETAASVLGESRAQDRPPTEVAEAWAWRRIEAARRLGRGVASGPAEEAP